MALKYPLTVIVPAKLLTPILELLEGEDIEVKIGQPYSRRVKRHRSESVRVFATLAPQQESITELPSRREFVNPVKRRRFKRPDKTTMDLVLEHLPASRTDLEEVFTKAGYSRNSVNASLSRLHLGGKIVKGTDNRWRTI